MTAAAADLRVIYGPHAAKKIARDFGVAVVTAKTWLAGRVPMARRDEFAARINAELDRRDIESAAIRRRWAGDVVHAGVETDRAVARGRAVEARSPADALGGRVRGGFDAS